MRKSRRPQENSPATLAIEKQQFLVGRGEIFGFASGRHDHRPENRCGWRLVAAMDRKEAAMLYRLGVFDHSEFWKR
jgi:hypothetical protein